MSGSKHSVLVSRNYKTRPDDCARALELLLQTSERKEGGPAAAPDDAKERSMEDPSAIQKYTK
jgi:hypothetical protein